MWSLVDRIEYIHYKVQYIFKKAVLLTKLKKHKGTLHVCVCGVGIYNPQCKCNAQQGSKSSARLKTKVPFCIDTTKTLFVLLKQ